MTPPARRAARFRPVPLPQKEGLDAVRVVPLPHEVGASIRTLLVTRYPALVSGEARDLDARFAAGDFVDRRGKAWGPEDPVERASEIFFYRDLAHETVEPVEIPVVYEDEHLLVVDKPRGMATIPRGEHVRRSALVRLRIQHANPELSPIHRLDKQTGGLLVLSKVAAERGAYQQLFSNRAVEKKYVARVRVTERGAHTLASLAHGSVHIEAPIFKEHGDMWAHVDDRGKPAHTIAHMIRRDGPEAMLSLQLLTGRTHQLRVHLDHVGLPIVGDELYPMPPVDSRSGERERRSVADDLHLWCTEMSFVDPVTGVARRFRAMPAGTECE